MLIYHFVIMIVNIKELIQKLIKLYVIQTNEENNNNTNTNKIKNKFIKVINDLLNNINHKTVICYQY